jgi:predicted aconitase
MPKSNRGPGLATQRLPANDLRHSVSAAAPAVNALQLEIRAAVAAELAPLVAMLEEVVSTRQSDVVDTNGLCAHFDFSPPVVRKLINAGCPHFLIGEMKRFSITAVSKFLGRNGGTQ